MYSTRHEFAKFDTTDSRDMEAYKKLLNNPLCTILENHRERLTSKRFDEGKLIAIDEKIVIVVEWDERYIA